MIGYIYCITNIQNGHQYVGKTLDSIEHRLKQHIKDSTKDRCKDRPLYRAINLYGIDSFTIKTLEEVDHHDLAEREQYWIQKLNTYKDGYNATLGGEGRILYNYEDILDKFLSGMLIKEIAEYFDCDPHTVTKVIQNNALDGRVNRTKRSSMKVYQFDKNNNFIREFESRNEAARTLIAEGITDAKPLSVATNIGRVISGARASCYNFIWRDSMP